MQEVTYLDAAASTPLAPEARAAMLVALDEPPGNPGAAHESGRRARRHLDVARDQIADLMAVGTRSVLFTSGATEANNLALRGVFAVAGERRRVIATATEHRSVLATIEHLAELGADVQVLPVDGSGRPILAALRELLAEPTAVVSVHAANNETGVTPDLAAICELTRAAGAWLHSDASQLMAWGDAEPVSTCDLVTVSSHKMYGPQGAAALIASRDVRAHLQPTSFGGGQEQGLRSGTPNIAALAGFGAAAELARMSGAEAAPAVRALRDKLFHGLQGAGLTLTQHAAEVSRLPNILSIGLPSGLDGEVVLAQTPTVAASTGSACHAGTPEPSPVLRAMGLNEQAASGVLRFSLSRYSTEAEVERATAALAATLRRLATTLGGDHQDQDLQKASLSA